MRYNPLTFVFAAVAGLFLGVVFHPAFLVFTVVFGLIWAVKLLGWLSA